MVAMTTLVVRDETSSGERTHSIALEFLTERITVRELIRSRVFQEVKDYNTRLPEVFQGLVQPEAFERTLNGFRKMRDRKAIDWEKQFARAIEGFETNQIIILVDDRQAEGLEEEIVITPETTVSFVRLVPLVGG